MKAYKCDRCGKFFGDIPEGCLMVWEDEQKLDICPTCYRQLSRWVAGPKAIKRPLQDAIETPELNGGFVFK